MAVAVVDGLQEIQVEEDQGEAPPSREIRESPASDGAGNAR
jgi:hypothetical protein